MTPPFHIAFFGECMIELSGLPLKKGFGGDTLNTALYLARLTANHPITVSYATGLGTDPLSEQLLAAWQEEGLHTTLVQQYSDKLPGLYLVETDPQGERRFMYWRDSAAAKSYFTPTAPSKLEQAIQNGEIDCVYLSGISLAILNDTSKQQLINTLRDFSQSGGTIIFDNNFRPQLWRAEQARNWYSQLLPLVDIALITEEDDLHIWGDEEDKESVEQRCARFGCREIVIKRGSHPCKVIWQQNGEPHQAFVAAQQVTHVVDTCAAGDSFAAGYLAARLSGQSAEASAALGHQLASIVIQFSGAIIPKAEMAHLTLC